MSKIINDENINELDTSQEELITENYALEILGLKNIADFRKFSRSFAKLDKIVKELDNETKEELEKKLDKGENLEEGYNTAVKIVSDVKKKQYKEDSALKTIAKTIVGAINELFANKLEKGGYTGNAKNLNDEISKKAGKTVLGRMIVGDNLTVDSNGRVSGNPQYTHPVGNGNNHIPSGGASGQVVKYSSAGTGVWGKVTWSEVDGKPSTMTPSNHNHTSSGVNAMTGYKKPTSTSAISTNDTLNGAIGKLEKALDGKASSSHSHTAGQVGAYTKAEIDTKLNEKANTSHKHKKSEITDFPASLKNPSALTISLNGTSQGAYDGSSAKSINVTAGGIGAYTKAEVDSKLGGKANSTHSHTASQVAQDSTHRFVTDAEKSTWNGKLNKGSLPAKITDAKGLYDLIENNSGLNFDTALLYLNDAGTKYKDKIYFDRNKKGMFKCITQTTSTTNSTSYFVDISNEANADQFKKSTQL